MYSSTDNLNEKCHADVAERVCKCAESVKETLDEDEPKDLVTNIEISTRTKSKWMNAVIDTAAFSTWIDRTLFESLGGKIRDDRPVKAADVEGKPISVSGEGVVNLNFWGARFENCLVRVMDNLPSGVIIGNKFLRRIGFSMDLDNLQCSIRFRNRKYRGRLELANPENSESISAVIEDEDVDDHIKHMDLSDFHSDNLIQENLRNVLWKHREVFKGMGCVKGYEHEIKLKPGTKPIAHPIRRRSPAERKTEEETMRRLLGMGILEPSESEWASNNVFVPKKDHGTRCTSDFRSLNACTIPDQYPMERVEETVEWLAMKKYFSLFDLKDGFFHVLLHLKSRPLTAIRTVIGLLQYTRLPQGLRNSPAVFQRIVNLMLGPLKGKCVWAFIDDGCIGSETPEEHIKDLDEVLSRLKEGGMRIKLSKCRIGKRDVEILGHRVDENGVRPSEGHVEAVKGLKEPTNLKELLRFLGLMNYFSSFIPFFSDRAKPLYEILKGSGFNKKKSMRKKTMENFNFASRWNMEQQNAWRDLKLELSNPNILAAPDNSKSKVLMADASDYGIGAVLLQSEDDGRLRPVSFTSRKLTPAECKYTVTEKECLAIVHSLKKWRHYLHGGPTVTILSDHECLKWLMSLKEPKGRLARWVVEIQEYDYVLQHVPGTRMAPADTLSRDTVSEARCPKCNELIKHISEGRRSLPEIQKIREEQEKEFGDLEEFSKSDAENYIIDDDGLLCKTKKNETQIIIPRSLIDNVLQYAHGSKVCGHRGVHKTLSWIKKRFFWKGINRDVSHYVRKCLHCSLGRLSAPHKQGRMKTWHPLRRFQFVAIDVLEVSTSTGDGMKKAAVIGDMFSRFVWAVPIPDETAKTVAKVLLDEWILRFGPPEKLLSDRGKTFTSQIISNLCEKMGCKKVFTSPYHPQTDGFVERFNRTVMKDIRAFVSANESDWSDHLSMACFRYNTTENSATKMTPYKAVFGIEAFDFDAEAGKRMAIDEECQSPEELQKRLKELHYQLHLNGTDSRMSAAKQYNKLVQENEYEIGDRVMIFNPRHCVERGRKLKFPWIGPYRIDEKLTSVAYMVRSEIGGHLARVHVNRLRAFDDDVNETGDPLDGVFPDSRRIIQSIIDVKARKDKRKFKVKAVFSNTPVWIDEEELPSLIVKEYDAIRKSQGDSAT